jgi:peptidoglycan/xylan/chitin deacetylase (PgdA/CDA1 family)
MRRPAFASLAAGAAVAGMGWAVRGRSSAVFGPSVWRGQPGRKAMALTFDDGPGAGTVGILKILAAYGVPATFFQCGQNVRRAPEISHWIRASGHEIGNHSHTHPYCALQPPSFIEAEFQLAQEAIADAAGIEPVLMRAPYGVRWFGFAGMQKRLGLTGVMWSVIGCDWKLPAEAVANRVVAGARDGAIVCLHDGRGILKDPDISSSIEAVRRIVPELLEEGYRLETVSQLLCPTTN